MKHRDKREIISRKNDAYMRADETDYHRTQRHERQNHNKRDSEDHMCTCTMTAGHATARQRDLLNERKLVARKDARLQHHGYQAFQD